MNDDEKMACGMTRKTIVYKSLMNAAQVQHDSISIHQRIVIVDLSLVVSSFHLQLATYKALLNESQGRMKTESISSEVLYQLSTSTDIERALQEFRIHAGSTEVAFILVDTAETAAEVRLSVEQFKSEISKLAIDGIEIDLEELSSPSILTAEKEARIANFFNISDEDLIKLTLEESVANRLAAKDTA